MKLTPSAVADIRRRRADGEKLLSLALDYGVSVGRIGQICKDIVLAEPRAGVRRPLR